MTSKGVRTFVFAVVGLGLIIYNAVIGDSNAATFTAGLILCGIPAVISLDSLIKLVPTKAPDPPVKEPVP